MRTNIVFVGDSHINSFIGRKCYLGPVTLKRLSYPDYVIDQIVKKYKGKKYFLTGEIDIRCHHTPYDYKNVIERYCNRIAKLGCAGIISIPPPAEKEKAVSVYPVVNSDFDRNKTTFNYNYELKRQCEIRGWHYVDIYSKYEKNGMLNNEFSDGTVHVKQRSIKI